MACDDSRCSLFRNHVYCTSDVKAWNLWENTGIDHAQAGDSFNSELGVQNGLGIVSGTNGDRAACMMAPCLIPNPLLYSGLALDRGARNLFCESRPDGSMDLNILRARTTPS